MENNDTDYTNTISVNEDFLKNKQIKKKKFIESAQYFRMIELQEKYKDLQELETLQHKWRCLQ